SCIHGGASPSGETVKAEGRAPEGRITSRGATKGGPARNEPAARTRARVRKDRDVADERVRIGVPERARAGWRGSEDAGPRGGGRRSSRQPAGSVAGKDRQLGRPACWGNPSGSA